VGKETGRNQAYTLKFYDLEKLVKAAFCLSDKGDEKQISQMGREQG